MTDDMQDKEFVEYVLKTVVDNPNDVHVDRTIDEMGVLLSVTVNPDDMGKVIGKSGQTAKAIRTLLKVVGAKHDARVNMKIIEPEDGQGGGAPAAAAAAPAADVTQAAAEHTQNADDVPLSETSVGEAAAAQHETDAALPQPNDVDSDVDDATGKPVPDEPRSAAAPPPESTPAASESDRQQAVYEEKSPLDEL